MNTVIIKEQVINDLPTGLKIIFEIVSSGEGRMRLRGDILPLGNRDFAFSQDGQLVGAGTGLACCNMNEETGELYDKH